MAGSRGAKTETGVSITDLGDLDFTSTGKKLTPYKIDPDTAYESPLIGHFQHAASLDGDGRAPDGVPARVAEPPEGPSGSR